MGSNAAMQSSYFVRIWRLRHFWSSLVCNDVVNRYRRSLLGIGWSLFRPLSMTAVFCVVFGTLFNQPTAEYVPYLMLGLAVWQYIHESILAGAACFTNSAAYIRQQRIPLAIFSMRAAMGSGFHFLIALVVAIAVTIWFKGVANPLVALAALPGLLILFVFCWAAATVVGLVQTHFRDAGHLLEIGLQILFYLTPIVYRAETFPDRTGLLMFLEWNPVHSLLLMVRQPILEGTPPPLQNAVTAVGFVGITVLAAWACLRRLERTLVFWL